MAVEILTPVSDKLKFYTRWLGDYQMLKTINTAYSEDGSYYIGSFYSYSMYYITRAFMLYDLSSFKASHPGVIITGVNWSVGYTLRYSDIVVHLSKGTFNYGSTPDTGWYDEFDDSKTYGLAYHDGEQWEGDFNSVGLQAVNAALAGDCMLPVVGRSYDHDFLGNIPPDKYSSLYKGADLKLRIYYTEGQSFIPKISMF